MDISPTVTAFTLTHGWASQETELSLEWSVPSLGSNFHGFENPHVHREIQKHAQGTQQQRAGQGTGARSRVQLVSLSDDC